MSKYTTCTCFSWLRGPVFVILQYIAETGMPIQRIERIEPTLESLFWR